MNVRKGKRTKLIAEAKKLKQWANDIGASTLYNPDEFNGVIPRDLPKRDNYLTRIFKTVLSYGR